MSTQTATKTPIENGSVTENGFLELTDEELLHLIDRNAQGLLGISGEEFLRRYREKDPLVDDLGRPVPAWGPIAMLASLFDE